MLRVVQQQKSMTGGYSFTFANQPSWPEGREGLLRLLASGLTMHHRTSNGPNPAKLQAFSPPTLHILSSLNILIKKMDLNRIMSEEKLLDNIAVCHRCGLPQISSDL